jgi:hypothetical protein
MMGQESEGEGTAEGQSEGERTGCARRTTDAARHRHAPDEGVRGCGHTRGRLCCGDGESQCNTEASLGLALQVASRKATRSSTLAMLSLSNSTSTCRCVGGAGSGGGGGAKPVAGGGPFGGHGGEGNA